jgi:hypothetical protein
MSCYIQITLVKRNPYQEDIIPLYGVFNFKTSLILFGTSKVPADQFYKLFCEKQKPINKVKSTMCFTV